MEYLNKAKKWYLNKHLLQIKISYLGYDKSQIGISYSN